MTDLRGLQRACLYALPPHEKGLCGPKKKQVSLLQDFVTGEFDNANLVRDALRQFQALSMYCKEIAKANKIEDPFVKEVIDAYFIGNSLLNVFFDSNAKRIPYHAYHVLKIGSITGRIKFDNRVRNLCIINYGKVVKLQMGVKKVLIDQQPLIETKQGIFFGAFKTTEVEWNSDFIPVLMQDDKVSVHWGKIIEVLKKEEVERLKEYTQKTLEFLNNH